MHKDIVIKKLSDGATSLVVDCLKHLQAVHWRKVNLLHSVGQPNVHNIILHYFGWATRGFSSCWLPCSHKTFGHLVKRAARFPRKQGS